MHVFLNRTAEKVFLFLATLSLKELAEDEDALDAQSQEMALESLKEQARANDFANQEDEEDLIVNENSLMDLVNRISSMSSDVAMLKKKIDTITKKVKFTSQMQEVAGNIDSGKLVQQPSAESEPVDAILSPPPPKSLAKGVDAQHTAERSHGAGGFEQGGGDRGEKGGRKRGSGGDSAAPGEDGGKSAGKGVSFAIAGAAFGKPLSRTSSNTSSLSGRSGGEARLDTSRRRACFDSVQGIHMQWLPSHCAADLMEVEGGARRRRRLEGQ